MTSVPPLDGAAIEGSPSPCDLQVVPTSRDAPSMTVGVPAGCASRGAHLARITVAVLHVVAGIAHWLADIR